MSNSHKKLPKTTHMLKIPPAEWQKAEGYFKVHPDATKMRKQKGTPNQTHSFIKVNNKIYALADGELLGVGGTAKVKMVEDRDGFNFAVKVTGRGSKKEVNDNLELEITELLNFSHGQIVRDLGQPKLLFKDRDKAPEKNKMVVDKVYTILNYLPGRDLTGTIYEYDYGLLNFYQALTVGIKSALVVQKLHDKGIVHGDLKEQNFMATLDNYDVKIRATDFGYSQWLDVERNQKEVIAFPKGTEGYGAPEVKAEGRFSFASDVYALGAMWKAMLSFPQQEVDRYETEIPLIEQGVAALNTTYKALKTQVDSQENDKIKLTNIAPDKLSDPEKQTLAKYIKDEDDLDQLQKELKEEKIALKEIKETLEAYKQVRDFYENILNQKLMPLIDRTQLDDPEERPSLSELVAAFRNVLKSEIAQDPYTKGEDRKKLFETVVRADRFLKREVDAMNELTAGRKIVWSINGHHKSSDPMLVSDPIDESLAKKIQEDFPKLKIIPQPAGKCVMTADFAYLKKLKEMKAGIKQRRLSNVSPPKSPPKSPILSAFRQRSKSAGGVQNEPIKGSPLKPKKT